jgi:hypothetical protein
MTARRTALTVVGVAGVILAGCGQFTAVTGSPTPAPKRSVQAFTASPYPSKVAGARAAMPDSRPGVNAGVDRVALAGVRAVEASDTAADAEPNDTVRRAAAWLTPAFVARVRAYPPVAAPGASWNAWAAHRAYLKVTVSLTGDDHRADSTRVAYRQVVAVLHPVGRDGWRGQPLTRVVFVSLATVRGQWRLAAERSTGEGQ